MSYFYKRYCELCAASGKTVSGVAAAIGLSNAAASGWKKGKIPNDTTLAKLAAYFGVPVESLLHPPAPSIDLQTAIANASRVVSGSPHGAELLTQLVYDQLSSKIKKPATVSGDEPEDVTRKIMDLLSDFSYEELVLALARIRKIKESR